MRVRVLFFGPLAEHFGQREEWLELAGEARAADVYAHYRRLHPPLGELGRDLLLAVNQEFTDAGTALREGDEVALLPPMSGGAPIEDRYVALAREPLRMDVAREFVARPGHGAVAIFAGVVRDHHAGKAIRYLEYEAYEAMALRRMEAIAAETLARWPIGAIALLHRLGRLEIGAVSVIVAVGAAHRGPAFAACAHAIETVKRSVPIWKKEFGADGSWWVEGALPEAAAAPGAEPQSGHETPTSR